MFGAENADVEALAGSTQSVIFTDAIASPSADTVTFNLNSDTFNGQPVVLSGITLYVEQDSGGGSPERGVSEFSFYVGGVEQTLTGPNGASTGTGTALTPDPTPDAANTYTFAAPLLITSLTSLEASFTPLVVEPGSAPGPRIVELDAVTVPEPASAGLVLLAAGGLLNRRRKAAC
jgi:hypothetical protein